MTAPKTTNSDRGCCESSNWLMKSCEWKCRVAPVIYQEIRPQNSIPCRISHRRRMVSREPVKNPNQNQLGHLIKKSLFLSSMCRFWNEEWRHQNVFADTSRLRSGT